jgi:hypothetical protein
VVQEASGRAKFDAERKNSNQKEIGTEKPNLTFSNKSYFLPSVGSILNYRYDNRFAPAPLQLPVVEAAGDEGGEEGRHANEDSDDEDADLNPGHSVV